MKLASIMKQRINSNTNPEWPNIEVEFDRPIRFLNDYYEMFELMDDKYKILYLRECEAINPMQKQVISNKSLFDMILTYNNEILNACPENAHMLLFGSTWVYDYKEKEKEFGISNLVGHKYHTNGHKLRHVIHNHRYLIDMPTKFFISQQGGVMPTPDCPFLGDKKEPLFDYQFHICVENSQQENYFTEKIIDCFITKTVPVYWGCPNIGNFFDLNGIIQFNSFPELLMQCSSINEETYKSKLEAIETNFQRAQQYIDVTGNVEKKIIEILKK